MAQTHHHRFTKWVALYLCGAVSALPAANRSDISETLRLNDSNSLPRGSVFVYGDPSLDPLVPVRVLGAVGKAGVHFVPRDTDLLTVISLAGGTTKEAELDDVRIKRSENGKVRLLTADLQQMVTRTDAQPLTIVANDTILVPQSKPTFSDDTLRTVGIITGIATVFASLMLAFKK